MATDSPVCVTVSALDGGHLTLPERLFVTDADPEKRATVPSLAFLIRHPSPLPAGGSKVTRIVFDLGIKRDLSGYTPAQRAHIAQRQPVITDPDCAASLRSSKADKPLDPAKDIDFVILSHVHWDHVGTPSDFPRSTFVVGSGTLDLLKNGAGPLYPAELFNDDELPASRAVEFPAVPNGATVPAETPKHTPTPPDTAAILPASAAGWAWRPLAGFPAVLDFFNDGSMYVIDSPGHLFGHVNLLVRLAPRRYVYLGGDCCHDPRILSGEKGIAMYDDGRGGMRSVHVDTGVAARTLERIRDFVRERKLGGDEGEVEVEVVVAHDATWRERNRERFWPEQVSPTQPVFPNQHKHSGCSGEENTTMPSTPADTVAFIGLGVMGYPMAKNLRAGLGPYKKLLICDVNSNALHRFKEETEGKGPVEIVGNGFEAAKAANVVITMLPGSEAVKTVYVDPQTGILAGVAAAAAAQDDSTPPPGHKLIMECGTIESDTILAVAKTAEEVHGVTFVDAPVSGGPMAAEKATLTFMVGCPPSASATVFPLVKSHLQHMGNPEGIFLCGDVGAGTAFKIINNYLSAITSLAAAEALNIGVRAGLDPKLLTDVINVSGGQCWVTSKANPVPGVQPDVPSSRGYEGGFRIELCAKVLGMGSRLAEMVGARTVLDRPTLDAFGEAMADERYRGKDARVVYKWLNESERK
ncbi:NAD binding domain of 6-phosphogluconate dehydrogenase-domain-containing protein [Achaetomium macrosporum]|uniref:3-hydroxyisobutyrate dehydrogenase n=1 Tax=Achaetomium macrosporum TaxID=79813 RepID=A0AAN7CE15_9PEZI|nr:NAD binding domain of 6-phosphogluconate dehydrogenase-domain-containing protein [Achaetomium macrosporum]